MKKTNCIHIFVGKSLSLMSAQGDTSMNTKDLIPGNAEVNLRLLHTGVFFWLDCLKSNGPVEHSLILTK